MTTSNKKALPSLAALVLRMKREILTDMREGIIPPARVTCFSDLHDWVDANEYGGFCSEEFAECGGITCDEAQDLIAQSQGAIHQWLASGGHQHLQALRLSDLQEVAYMLRAGEPDRDLVIAYAVAQFPPEDVLRACTEELNPCEADAIRELQC